MTEEEVRQAMHLRMVNDYIAVFAKHHEEAAVLKDTGAIVDFYNTWIHSTSQFVGFFCACMARARIALTQGSEEMVAGVVNGVPDIVHPFMDKVLIEALATTNWLHEAATASAQRYVEADRATYLSHGVKK